MIRTSDFEAPVLFFLCLCSRRGCGLTVESDLTVSLRGIVDEKDVDGASKRESLFSCFSFGQKMAAALTLSVD